MEIPKRSDLERRMHALVADYLDDLEQRFPEGFDLGVQVFIGEVHVPTETTRLLREEGGYTPGAGVDVRWRTWTSDTGSWVFRSLIREVHDYFEYLPAPVYDDDDEDDDGDSSDDE